MFFRCVHASLLEALSVRPLPINEKRDNGWKTQGNLRETSGKHQGTHRIVFLVEIQENSAKFKKIQENSAIYWTHRCSNRTC